MTDFNKVAVHGRIVKNAEFTRTDSGVFMARFAIATNRTRKMKDGTFVDDSSFFPIVMFGPYAELVAPRLLKAQGLLVDGFLKQSKWETNGEKHSVMEIEVNRLYFDADDIRKKQAVPVQNEMQPPVKPMVNQLVTEADADYPGGESVVFEAYPGSFAPAEADESYDLF